MTVRETVIRVLRADLKSATEHRILYETQQKRMAFVDQAHKDLLERTKQWESETALALLYITVRPEIL